MHTPDSTRLCRIASAVGLAAFLAISWLSRPRSAERAPPGAGDRTAAAPTAAAELPEVVVVAPRLDPLGPLTAH